MTQKFQLPILLYDHECPLCVRFKQSLEMMDRYKKINYHSLHEKEIFNEFPFLSEKECSEVVHLILEDQSVLRGPEVLTYLIKQFPGVDRFSWLLETDKGKKVVDFFYQKMEELRYKTKSLHEECPRCPKN